MAKNLRDIISKNAGRNVPKGEEDFPITHSFPNLSWKNTKEEFQADIDIVLMDINHKYFYEEYTSPIKIAFTVWESTELEEGFFNQLLKFDYVWVVTDWHRKMIIDQGYPAYRVFVVNEGVDSSLYNKKPSKSPRDKFEFMFFGRWDYRKSLPEIVKSFIDAFPDNDEVELILSADNPYSIDGFNSKTAGRDLIKFSCGNSSASKLQIKSLLHISMSLFFHDAKSRSKWPLPHINSLLIEWVRRKFSTSGSPFASSYNMTMLSCIRLCRSKKCTKR
jgi:glycosyltransferase involved in cell wall biosynthesis